ncbi:MAG TPA: arylsulfatase [Verrucomicrobiae bacterium]|nr:arylsulfatase [Verrucomicrobiae bacterium]
MDRRQFLTTLGAGVFAAQAQQAERPNIVLIYADDVGYGDLSCYGARRVRTPNLDRLAGGGVRFTNVHASSATCTPSRYTLLTGEYAWRKPGTGVLPGDARLIVPTNRQSLPGMLRERGYRTGVVGKWHLGLGEGNIDWNGEVRPGPLEVGFDYSFIIPATGDRVPCVFVENHRVANLDPNDPIRVSYERPIGDEPTGSAHPELLRLHPSHGHDQAIVNGVPRIGYMTGGKSALWVDEDIADTITGKAVRFIEENKARPFFLYFATHDIHVPRIPNPRFVGKTPMGPRGDAIAELDWSVGQVVDTLDRLKLTRNTILMFSSDNGPVVDDGYRDEAVQKLGDHKPAGPLRGGKYSNFDGGTRVPMMLRWPGHVKPDSVSPALLSHVDFFASLADLTGGRPAAGAAPDSVDMLPAMLGRDRKGRDWLVEHAGSLALIEGNWKFIAPGNGPKMNRNTNTEMGNDPQPQLYDLSSDIAEQHNLAAEHPDRVKSMSEHLQQIRGAAR